MAATRFSDRVAWLTGASSGIGRALAVELSHRGARLILSGRDADRLEETRQLCSRPSDVRILPFDLADPDALPRIASQALAMHGHIDYMIHNAGVAHRGLAADTAMDVDRHIMAANYFGPVILTKALLPSMLARKSGCFVVISSLSGKYGGPCMSAYAASKHALHGFFESLAAEVHDQNVQVVVVIPGFIQTDITKHAMTGSGQPYGKVLSVHRRGMSPEQCARKTLQAVAAGRREALIGGTEVWSTYLHRLAPSVMARIIRSHPLRLQRRFKRFLGLTEDKEVSDD